jgi:signal peptidase I
MRMMFPLRQRTPTRHRAALDGADEAGAVHHRTWRAARALLWATAQTRLYHPAAVGKYLKFLAWVVGILAIIAIVLRLTVFEVWTVPDDPELVASLAPTLRAGDMVLVMRRGDRGLNDLVRCKDPDYPQQHVVARLVGVGGETVEFQGLDVAVDRKRYTSSEACAEGIVTFPHPKSGAPMQGTCNRVEMGGGWHYRLYSADGYPIKDQKHTVGAGRVYLVSDNRSFHLDSRDYGALPKADCPEKVVFRLWGKPGFFNDTRRFELIR